MFCPEDTSRSVLLPLGSDAALRRRFMVAEETMPGNLRFGLLLEVLDKLAEETALAYAQQVDPAARVVTAAIDNIFIRNAADVGRDLAFHARINHVGRSSMEVGIRVEHPGSPGLHIASCYFTMVARSGSGETATSLTLPSLTYNDGEEMERMEKALASREAYRLQQAVALAPPVVEEFALLNRLHLAQDEKRFAGHLAGGLKTESWERMYPEQENVPKSIFGGYLIRRAYELASICAEQLAPDRPVIVAVNRINFFHPVRLDDKLHFTARVVYSGATSVVVEANIERISRDRSSKAISNSCLFTFANVDRTLTPRSVPPLYPTTYGEDARYLQAYRQHQAYRQAKGQGKFHH